MKIFHLLSVLGTVFLLSGCPVRNAYDMEEYQTQSSYKAIFENKTVPDDVQYNL